MARLPKAQILSYVFGSLALVLLLISAFMLAFLRIDSDVLTIISPTIIPYVTPVPFPLLHLNEINVITQFIPLDLTQIVAPVVSVGEDPVEPTGVLPTVIPTLPFGPGLLPFASTINMPLISPCQGMGFCVMTANASQWFSSFENGYSAFSQYVTQQGTGTGLTYVIHKTSYPSVPVGDPSTTPSNYIFFNCPVNDPTGSQAVPTINEYSSSVGSVGYNSMALSQDDNRLYIGFRQPFTGTSDQSLLFPNLQTIGRINVYSLPETSGLSQSSTDWTYECQLGLQNPFGSQFGGSDGLCDPITKQILIGDDFGSIIRTTVNLNTGNRVIASRANFGFVKENGACISIWEENSNKQHIISGVIQLWDSYAGSDNKFTLNAKLSFGRDFNISNNVLLAAIRVPSTDCIGSVTPIYKIAYFKRNDTLALWQFQNFIQSPNLLEDFGVSILISPDASYAIVGSPTLPVNGTPGIGGTVYVYTLSSSGTWNLNSHLSDPFASVNTKGAFGYFLSSDPLFVVLSISANQNNVLTAPPTFIEKTETNDRPKVVFVSIDQTGKTLSNVSPQIIAQPGTSQLNQYLDPLFGCNLAFAFTDNAYGKLIQICLASPMNQTVSISNMSPGK